MKEKFLQSENYLTIIQRKNKQKYAFSGEDREKARHRFTDQHRQTEALGRDSPVPTGA